MKPPNDHGFGRLVGTRRQRRAYIDQANPEAVTEIEGLQLLRGHVGLPAAATHSGDGGRHTARERVMAKRRASALSAPQPEAKLVASAPAETKYCTGCQTHHPRSAFLVSRFTPDRLTDNCLAAIRRIAERDRLARERRLQELEAKRSQATNGRRVGLKRSAPAKRARARGRGRGKNDATDEY